MSCSVLNMHVLDSIFGYVIARSLMNTPAFTELSYLVLEQRYPHKRPGNPNRSYSSLNLQYARPLGGASGIDFNYHARFPLSEIQVL